MTARKLATRLLLPLCLLLLSHPPAFAGTLETLSVSSGGTPTYDEFWKHLNVGNLSKDNGRAVFYSWANGLVPTDYNNRGDAFLRDRTTEATTILTPTGFYASATPLLSGNGRFVAFSANPDVYSGAAYLLDIQSGELELIATRASAPSNLSIEDINFSGEKVILSANDGIYRYDSSTKNLDLIYPSSTARIYAITTDDSGELVCFAEKDASGTVQTYVYDIATGSRELISQSDQGVPGNNFNTHARISKSGRYVIFHSWATNLLPEPYPQDSWNLFLYDREAKNIERLNFYHPAYGQLFPTRNGYNKGVADISDDGRYISACLSDRTPSGSYAQIWPALLDRQTGRVEFTSDNPDGNPVQGLVPRISNDGRYVLFKGTREGAPYGRGEILLYDRQPKDFAVSAGGDRTIEQTMPDGAYVTLSAQLTEGDCDENQSYDWAWEGGSALGTEATLLLPPGVTTVTLTWTGCGATATDSVDISVLDTAPPTVTADLQGTVGNSGWYRSPVEVTLAATDAGSGVREILYSVDGDAPTVDPGETARLVLAGDGPHALSFHAFDLAGNQSSPPQSLSIRVDTIAPLTIATLTGRMDDSGVFVADPLISLSADDKTSGVQEIHYQIDGGPMASIADSSANLTVTGDGQHSLTFYAVDMAGNIESLHTVSITIDKSRLAALLVEDIAAAIHALPASAFVNNNPNDLSKLIKETEKILTSLQAIDPSASASDQSLSLEWSAQKLSEKLQSEINRTLDSATVSDLTIMLNEAIAAINARIETLRQN